MSSSDTIPLRDGRRIVIDAKGNGRIVDGRDLSGGGVDGDTQIPLSTAEQFAERQEAATNSRRGNGPLALPGPSYGQAQTAGSTPARRSPKQPNVTELRYARSFLQPRICGDPDSFPILWFEFELLSLRMPPALRYTPDWVAMTEEGRIEFHEVKGKHRHARHGIERFRWAKERWGAWFRFVLAKWDGKDWEIE
jgi:hypothetical protein